MVSTKEPAIVLLEDMLLSSLVGVMTLQATSTGSAKINGEIHGVSQDTSASMLTNVALTQLSTDAPLT